MNKNPAPVVQFIPCSFLRTEDLITSGYWLAF